MFTYMINTYHTSQVRTRKRFLSHTYKIRVVFHTLFICFVKNKILQILILLFITLNRFLSGITLHKLIIENAYSSSYI